LMAQDEEPRQYDQEQLARWNTSEDFDYNREIPPPNNYLRDILTNIAQAIYWLFSHAVGYVILIGLIALLVWIIVKNTSSGQWRPKNRQDQDDGLQVHTREDLEQEDFESLINRALQDGNYRLAVRYCFLSTLKVLQLKGLIDWHIEKTNYEYLHELPEQYHIHFLGVLNIYEFVWYGEFEANQKVFDSARQQAGEMERGLQL